MNARFYINFVQIDHKHFSCCSIHYNNLILRTIICRCCWHRELSVQRTDQFLIQHCNISVSWFGSVWKWRYPGFLLPATLNQTHVANMNTSEPSKTSHCRINFEHIQHMTLFNIDICRNYKDQLNQLWMIFHLLSWKASNLIFHDFLPTF